MNKLIMKIEIGVIIIMLIFVGFIGYWNREAKTIENKEFDITCKILTGKVHNFDGNKECIMFHYDKEGEGYYKTYITLRQLKKIEFIVDNY